MPAVRRFACAQSHLGRFAFGDSHVSGLEKQSLWKTQTRSHFFNFNLSSALQSDFRFVSAAAAIVAAAALQTRPPSRSQRGCAGKFSKMSSRMYGEIYIVYGPITMARSHSSEPIK